MSSIAVEAARLFAVNPANASFTTAIIGRPRWQSPVVVHAAGPAASSNAGGNRCSAATSVVGKSYRANAAECSSIHEKGKVRYKSSACNSWHSYCLFSLKRVISHRAAVNSDRFLKDMNMRKTLLSALVASACAFGGGAFATPLSFNLDGAGNVISAQSLDWSQTSFLAKGGNAAITNFLTGVGPTTFDVMTHAKLTAYNDANGVTHSLPGSFTGEITVVSRFTERVTGAIAAAGLATFATTGAGWVEMYYSSAQDSENLTGGNFNNGTLIMRAEGVGVTAGNFSVTDATPINLDGFGAQDYTGQKTVSGFGSQGAIVFGSSGIILNSSFLQTAVVDFSLLFNNISIGLPYQTVDPSDCFNQNQGGALGAGKVSQCDVNSTTAHVNGTYAANGANVGIGGYVPVVGGVNGLFGGSPDFVAQTDFNSAVTGTPEPATLALLGLALAGLGLSRRRKS